MADNRHDKQRLRLRNPWSSSIYTVATAVLGFAALYLMINSFLTMQLDTKGCEMAYMRPTYSKFDNFDTEHTRLAGKYSLYLYREWGVDEEFTVKGVPVLFIPGNAGSYKQVRSLASEAAYHYHNSVQHELNASGSKRPLDFFSVDFNEDFTAFHGQTLLDQAEYLNDAITFILSLYHTPGSVQRDSYLPDPTSVLIVGHSMGGVVARTMVTMPNYQANSINTIVTLAAPHARSPVSFDGDMVRIYRQVNDYWRNAYAQKRAIDNPLWHVTLISIAGGGLDTIVSSDYADTTSLVPETHGFTVFTSSIPNVWTGMDHLAITWCDQARKSVVRALYDVIDVSRATQTVPRASRMRGFKKWFLTGLEDIVEKALPHEEAQTLLTLDETSATTASNGKLELRTLGSSDRRPSAYVLPIPTQATQDIIFTLLTNERLDHPGGPGVLEILFCNALASQPGQSTPYFSVNLDLSGDNPGATRYACKSAASDVVVLPESLSHSDLPFRTDRHPFAYLQYALSDLRGFEIVAIIDKSSTHSTGWVIAEFSSLAASSVKVDTALPSLLMSGASVQIPTSRPITMDIQLPALHSSLLAYDVHVGKQSCGRGELFSPLLRQYITNVYESKFFVNVENAKINIYGKSPYLPPALRSKAPSKGLSLQIWSDPTCKESNVEVTLKVDVLGSLGKLWMRYRIVFAAFPLLIVALVLRQQFRTYDETGVFMSFAQGLNHALQSSIPLSFTALTILSVFMARAQRESNQQGQFPNTSGNLTSYLDDTTHELLLGTDDPFFWFLVPLFGLMCTGICIAINYITLLLEIILAYPYALFTPSPQNPPPTTTTTTTTPPRRILTTLLLLSLTTTVIPYHLAYTILCITHLLTTTRATLNPPHLANFRNYTHSLLLLMLFLLPLNLPVLIVWIRNLLVHYLTPFSPHHNLLSITPFVLLVETMGAGRMVPRSSSWIRSRVTSGVFWAVGGYAAVYGVSYAYVLHFLVNAGCAWLVGLHFWGSGSGSGGVMEGEGEEGEGKKRP